MTIKTIKKMYAGILGIGLTASVATGIAAPSAFAPTLAVIGGALAGVSLTNEFARKREENMRESFRVASSFKKLYESNKGVVNPQQLSIDAEIPLDQALRFLEALAENQKASDINTEQGRIFNFPHPANVLDTLTNNAQAWAKSQSDPLLQQNAILKAELARLQMVVAQAPQPSLQSPARSLNNPEESKDLWNNLL
jgi:hypothetical protein